MHIQFALLISLVLVAATSAGSPLGDRNLPGGKLLYEDAESAYYGVYTTNWMSDPARVHTNPSNVIFRVFVFRVPEEDGSLIKLIPVPLVEDNRKNKGPGYRYAPYEQNIINNHVMRKVEELFPKRKSQNFLMLYVYARNKYFSTGDSRPDLGSENPDVKKPEREISIMTFSRKTANDPMVPGYAARNENGVIASNISRGLQDLYPTRKELTQEIIEQRRQRNASIEARYLAEARAIAAQGQRTVIKSREFWDRLQFSGTVKATFDGDYTGSPDNTFKVYYFSVQVAFSDSCKSSLSSDAQRRGYKEKTTFGDGWSDEQQYYWFIDPEFIGRFDEYSPRAFDYVKKQAGMLNPHDPIKQIKRFIDATGCGSAAVYQLRQNFLRAANSLESLQQEGVVIPGAAKEGGKEPPSMYGACHADGGSTAYCLCFERNAKTIMTAKEYEYFMAGFSSYYKEVVSILNNQVPVSDRRWRLNDIQNSCAN